MKHFHPLTLLCVCSVSLSLTLASCASAGSTSGSTGTGTLAVGTSAAVSSAASKITSETASEETTLSETAKESSGQEEGTAEESSAAAEADTDLKAAGETAGESAQTSSADPETTAQSASSAAETAAPGPETETATEAQTPAPEPETVPAAYNTVLYNDAQGRYLVYGSDGSASPLSTIVLPVSSYIDQVAEGAPMGCEAAALLMGLWSKGYCTDMSYQEFLTTMPYASDDNPNHGFVGTPYANDGNFDGINMPAVASWGARYASTADITGASEEDLIYQLYLGHPVVVWTSYKFGPTEPENYWWGSYKTNAHVMLLCGFNPATREFYIADPAPGGAYSGMVWVSWPTFADSYDVMRGAVAVW